MRYYKQIVFSDLMPAVIDFWPFIIVPFRTIVGDAVVNTALLAKDPLQHIVQARRLQIGIYKNEGQDK